jgi:hypothetical protein
VTRGYIVHTFGCQMNEHDSGAHRRPLGDDWLRRGHRSSRCRCRRAQHVLHPRERRQQAVRHARLAEAVEGSERRPSDRGCRLPGPEGSRPRARKAPFVDVVLGTHNVHRSCRTVGRGSWSADPSPRSSTRRCSTIRPCSPARLPGSSRDHLQRVGHHPDRFATTRALLHRARRSRVRRSAVRSPTSSPRFARLADEGVSEVTLARPERQQLRPRSAVCRCRQAGDPKLACGRCSPSC